MTSPATLNDPTLPVPDFLELDAACDQFEAAWREGERPNPAPYLSRVPAGARISAGNSGSVARSFPKSALALVKRSPVAW